MLQSLRRDESKNDVDTIIAVGAGSFSDLFMVENRLNEATAYFLSHIIIL